MDLWTHVPYAHVPWTMFPVTIAHCPIVLFPSPIGLLALGKWKHDHGNIDHWIIWPLATGSIGVRLLSAFDVPAPEGDCIRVNSGLLSLVVTAKEHLHSERT